MDTRKLLQPARQVGSIVPRAPTLAPHVHAREIGKGNLRSTRLASLCGCFPFCAISPDILTVAAFKQQIPCLLFHTSHHPKYF